MLFAKTGLLFVIHLLVFFRLPSLPLSSGTFDPNYKIEPSISNRLDIFNISQSVFVLCLSFSLSLSLFGFIFNFSRFVLMLLLLLLLLFV